MIRTVLALAALLAALAIGGCGDDDGGGNAVKADWDLSSSHTMRDVDWSDPDIDALNLQPIESVRLRFPGDHVFTASSGIARIGLTRNGDALDEVRLFADAATVDDAYALAQRWAGEYDLPLAPLQKWHAEGGSVEVRVLSVGPPGETVGDGGPEPSLEIIDSAVDDKPAQVVLSFGWV